MDSFTIRIFLNMLVLMTVPVLLTLFLRTKLKSDEQRHRYRILIGIVFGVIAVLNTHFGVDYFAYVLNVRDLAPMCAGFFFDPLAGIIAGLIGGIERYIAGRYWDIGTFSMYACSIATCLAGVIAAFMKKFFFNRESLSIGYAFFAGAAIEAFHMYAIFFTNRRDISSAFETVRTCSIPMILFNAVGMAVAAAVVMLCDGETIRFKRLPVEETPISKRFRFWLFMVTVVVVLGNFYFEFAFQTQYAREYVKYEMQSSAEEIERDYNDVMSSGGEMDRLKYKVGRGGCFVIVDNTGKRIAAYHSMDDPEEEYDDLLLPTLEECLNDLGKETAAHKDGDVFRAKLGGTEYLCYITGTDDGRLIGVAMMYYLIYQARDMMAYVTMLGIVVLFAVIYILVALLAQFMVVDKLMRVNESLDKITNGDMEEQVSVYDSSEFASLSNDINRTVDVLKGYISAAEKRMEQDLLLAATIQEASLPKNFDFNHKGFEIYATMNPAKEVGGDFYDFFFVDTDLLAMVIADVSGKGIPASLLMMRCKSAIRSLAETGVRLAETFEKVNDELCIGNEASMFVTTWMGIADLRTGLVRCVNAGHEYPAIMRNGGSFELFRDRHGLPLGGMEGMDYSEYEMQLEPGDVLFVYTDGLPEAVNSEVKQYGTDRMLEALNTCRNGSMQELLNTMHDDLHAFIGKADQFDDETMIGFRFNGMKDDDIDAPAN